MFLKSEWKETFSNDCDRQICMNKYIATYTCTYANVFFCRLETTMFRSLADRWIVFFLLLFIFGMIPFNDKAPQTHYLPHHQKLHQCGNSWYGNRTFTNNKYAYLSIKFDIICLPENSLIYYYYSCFSHACPPTARIIVWLLLWLKNLMNERECEREREREVSVINGHTIMCTLFSFVNSLT